MLLIYERDSLFAYRWNIIYIYCLYFLYINDYFFLMLYIFADLILITLGIIQ